MNTVLYLPISQESYERLEENRIIQFQSHLLGDLYDKYLKEIEADVLHKTFEVLSFSERNYENVIDITSKKSLRSSYVNWMILKNFR